MSPLRQLASERRGATLVEFALIAGIFLPLCLGVMEAGLVLWTKGGLQSAATLSARCGALSSANCPDVAQFAVDTAGNWVFPGIIAKADVTPVPAIVCLSHVQYMKVTITSAFWAGAWLPPPLNGRTLTVSAYFPAGSTAC